MSLSSSRNATVDLVAELVVALGDELPDLLLLQLLVDEAERLGHHVVQERPADRGLDDAAVPPHPDARLQIDVLVVVGDAQVLGVGEEPILALGAGALLGHVVDAEHHVLGGHGHRGAIGGRQDIVGREHQHLRLHLRFHGERNVHGHLVAVEVGIERRADERVDLDRLALDEQGLEGLNAEPVQGRGPVEQNRVLLDDFLQDVPDLGPLLLHELLGRLDGRRDPPLLELAQDERLEQLERHLLGQPALVELEVRPDDDDRPAGIVDALAEQVLAEAPLLALERIGQRLQRTVVRAGDDPPAPAVVEERVDRLLEHALLVPDDDLGRAQLHQPLEPVVAVDHAPIEIIEVRRREPAPVERHQRPQLRRDDRQHFEDHPLRLVAGLEEGLHDLEALHDLLLLLGRRLDAHLGAQLAGERLEVHAPQELADRLRAHAGVEGVLPMLFPELAHAIDGQEALLLDAGHRPGIDDHVLLEVQDLLEVAERHVEELADPARQPLEEPDVGDGGRELDVAHALAPHARPRDLDAALVADHARELHALVLAAGALVVLGGPEDPGAEQAVPLGLERPVVDRLGLLHLTVRPVADLLGRGQLDADRAKRHGLRMPIEEAPQILYGLVLTHQAAERPVRQHYLNLL